MSHKIIKFNFLFFLFLSFGLLYLSWPLIMRAESSDAIAVRILENPMHYSTLHWYKSQNFTGSPQSLQIDGYDAVRDGRTVYINIANITDKNSDGLPDFFETTIFVISYNQDAQGVTSDIFGQILKNFKFNTNLTELGTCKKTTSQTCLSDSECPVDEYCSSKKAKVIRDVRRLADLEEIKSQLENYKQKNNSYPKLKGGSYLPNKTISTWPSWQQSLAQELGVTLPVDPINKLGDCPNFNPVTCWNEENKTFASNLDQLILPNDSHAYVYSSNDLGNITKYCTQMESGYANLQSFNCLNNKTQNNQPVIKDVILTGHPREEFIGYASVADADGDPIKLTVDLISPTSGIWSTRRWQWDTGLNKFSVSLAEAGQRKIHAVKTGTTGLQGYYKIRLTVDDGQGEPNSTYSQIYDVKVSPIPATLEKKEKTVVIGTSETINVFGTDSNGDPLTSISLDNVTFNDAPLSASDFENRGFSIQGMSLLETYKLAQQTGVYVVNIYSIDPNITTNRIDSRLAYTIVNNPPVFKKLTATFSNNGTQICEPGQVCSIAIDNSENVSIKIEGTDPDNQTVKYSLVDTFGGKLSINPTSGLITGLEKLNFQQLTDQSFNIKVKIADGYCNNSSIAECSSIYSFDLLVEKYCSLSVPESTIQVIKAGPFIINQTGNKLDTGLNITDCSAIGSSSVDVKYIGESHSQAIVLVSDLSGSMGSIVYSGGTYETAVSRLKKALTTPDTGFFDKIYNTALKLPIDYFTKIGLVAYNKTIVSNLPLTDIVSVGALQGLKNEVNKYAANLETNTLLGLNTADASLAQITDAKVDKIVILMSDGIPGIDGHKDMYQCYTPDHTCDCGGTWPDCVTPPSCGVDQSYRCSAAGNSYECYNYCPCGFEADKTCKPRPSCGVYETLSYNWQISCQCIPRTCDSCGTGTYPDCVYPECLCGFNSYNCKCLPDDCKSVFNNFSKKTIGWFNIFKSRPVLAATVQTQCVSTCKTPTTCLPGQSQNCYASSVIPNCDLTLDVDSEASALKQAKVSIYTIYYNTSGSTVPKDKMCRWSSSAPNDCDANTYAFAGTDINMMINKVLSRIIIKPKDVKVDGTIIVDTDATSLTSLVTGAALNNLICGSIKPIVTYTNNGYLEFSNLKLNYCEAKLHS